MRFFAFGGIRTMNILIVGNGFDLSHYLPTKYDHFMDVMSAIEDKNTGGKVPDLTIYTVQEWMDILDEMFFKKNDQNSFKFEMNFDELSFKSRDPNFIEKTKEYYLTDNIVLSAQDVIKIQYRLSLNCWYQYFKNHVEEIKTWIDFEQKIEHVLIVAARCIADIENIYNSEELYKYFENDNKYNVKIRGADRNILDFFNFSLDEFYESEQLNALYPEKDNYQDNIGNKRININANFCNGRKIKNGLNLSLFLDFIQVQRGGPTCLNN